MTGHGFDAFSSGTGLTLVPGIKGQALSCPASGFDCWAANSRDSFCLKNFTIETWFNANSLPVGGQLKILDVSSIQTGMGNGYSFCILDGGTVDLAFWSVARDYWVDAISAIQIKAGQWYHLAGTYDGTSMKVYINGNLEATVACAGGPVYPIGDNARIGCVKTTDSRGVIYWADGRIDELKLYTYALSSDDIADHYAAYTSNDSIPVLIPMVPDTQTNRKPAFRWHPAIGAASYRIVIDTEGDFANPIVILPLLDTLFTPLADLPYGKIFWKVSANTNYTRYSAVDTFFVAAGTGAGNVMQREQNGVSSIISFGKGFHLTYTIINRARVTIKLFSMTGACIATLCDEERQPGTQQMQWNGVGKDGKEVPGGSYLAVCAIGTKVLTKKIVLVR